MTSEKEFPKIQLVDSHCHLAVEEFRNDLAETLRRARESGIVEIVCIGAGRDPAAAKEALGLAQAYPNIYATVGIHPHDASHADEVSLTAIEQLAHEEKVVAIGETGLDFFYDHSPRNVQERIFREFIRMARKMRKPLVVHVRDAHEKAIAVLREEQAHEVGGVIHCFSGSVAETRPYLDMGFHLSFSGALTFKNADTIRAACAYTPSERLLLETDAPYLAPVPYRGKRNEPAFIIETAQAMAAIQKLSFEDIARITTRNARRLFGIEDPEAQKRHIVYPIRNSLYLNITNRCTLACRFCGKRRDFTVRGHYLKLARDPSIEEIRSALAQAHIEQYSEIVFCGYGEPTLRLDVVLTLAGDLKQLGCTVRLNTDGLANLVYGRDVTPELGQVIDRLSVSMNAPDAVTYANLCPSRYGEAAYSAVLDFIRRARVHIREVIATVVAVPGLDIEACRRVAAGLGVAFRIREYDRLG